MEVKCNSCGKRFWTPMENLTPAELKNRADTMACIYCKSKDWYLTDKCGR